MLYKKMGVTRILHILSPPRPILFVDIGSLQRPSVATFGQKTVLMLRKRWRNICRCSVGSPFHVEIKSSS